MNPIFRLWPDRGPHKNQYLLMTNVQGTPVPHDTTVVAFMAAYSCLITHGKKPLEMVSTATVAEWAEGHARCASGNKFDVGTGIRIATNRAIRQALRQMHHEDVWDETFYHRRPQRIYFVRGLEGGPLNAKPVARLDVGVCQTEARLYNFQCMPAAHLFHIIRRAIGEHARVTVRVAFRNEWSLYPAPGFDSACIWRIEHTWAKATPEGEPDDMLGETRATKDPATDFGRILRNHIKFA